MSMDTTFNISWGHRERRLCHGATVLGDQKVRFRFHSLSNTKALSSRNLRL